MRILEPIRLITVLAEWGLHECHGRLQGQLPPNVVVMLGGPEGPNLALETILRVRAPVIAAILVARPMQCARVEIRSEDINNMRVMGPRPPTLQEWARRVVAGDDATGKWVKGLVSAGDVAGPFVAVARAPVGPMTLLDGLHRAAAWVAHCDSGWDYPLLVNVVVTEQPTWYERDS